MPIGFFKRLRAEREGYNASGSGPRPQGVLPHHKRTYVRELGHQGPVVQCVQKRLSADVGDLIVVQSRYVNAPVQAGQAPWQGRAGVDGYVRQLLQVRRVLDSGRQGSSAVVGD